MAQMDYDACYTALQLNFGAGLKEVNERWRKLSRKHHPDLHARDPKAHHQALERQKQINNARDMLTKWFELNPHAMPPRRNPNPGSPNAQSKSTNSQSTNQNTDQSRTSGSQQRTHNESHRSENTSQHDQHQWHYTHSSRSSTPQETSAQSATGATGWFKASTLKLTPMQELVHTIDRHCAGESPSFIGMILCFAGAFGPLFVITSVLGTVFPDLPGHYPDWMQAPMLFGSGWCSWYLFRWFFSEAELIKLQQKELYFKSNRTLSDTVELAKSTIAKQSRSNAEWKFTTNGSVHEATIEFVEEVFPEVKRPRHLVIRLEARPGKSSVVLAMEVKAKSPINSFSCKQMAEAVVTELKKELQPIAA